MISLQNKRVLYVAPKFFGYEQDIGEEFRRRGAHADFLLDRPFNTPFMTAVTRFKRDWIIKAADRYYRDALAALPGADYDLVFVVNGQTLSEQTLQDWRKRFPGAVFVMYMWDSFGNRPNAVTNMKYFDHVFTFDRNDAERYQLNFRPLFFVRGFEREPVAQPDYDISFVGTAHTDRYAVVSRVNAALPAGAVPHWYLYLQAPWVYWAYRVLYRDFRNAPRSAFRFEPLAKATVQSIFNNSRAILDVEHAQQTGLTMRTLETLGARKKLVTTNTAVRDYDFYRPANVCIIDRQQPRIPDDFFTRPYEDIAPEIYQRYRLEGWLDEMLAATGRF
ncbi:hypothetical protein CEG14_24800 [Bordetella genomosp. 1]|uniref:Uncharacterized protein n=1 Tax=Bordetella genomosp. 1 TaxID=1395607 RepID=A0A261RSU3_9BORD|nr:hypothetical protein [Bordetella genomosp. 1]OZI28136.1 hypothetical protein CEG14_24800 [Bordetella genomosp. 1]